MIANPVGGGGGLVQNITGGGGGGEVGGGGGCRPEHSTLGLGETLENVKLMP